MSQFAVIHTSKEAHQLHLKFFLKAAIHCPLTFISNFDRTAPDVIALSSCGKLSVYLMIGKKKNEFGDRGSDPSVQATFSFLHIFGQKEMTASISHPFSSFLCYYPAFIIAHVRPWLTIMGDIITTNYIIQRFTDFLWISAHSIHDDSQPLKKNILCVTYLTETIEDNPKNIVIKFITSYGIDAYCKMMSTGFVPQLLYYGPINMTPDTPSYGDLHIVMMEYVYGLMLKDALKQRKIPPRFEDDLCKTFKQLHSAGYIFSNLWQPNVIITPEEKGKSTVQLVDFDWARKEGKVKYPVSISGSIKWLEGVQGLDYIRKEHELLMLKSVMSQY
ncbi:hypothetical protein HD554DRAFT_2011554 [Boletus coccyginus]|nr:hypothetical protein HD554DRAFT_2011554 [Boletus coccyginus]